MNTIHLIRHGQASFGAADYDQLSALGQRQSVRLGEHLRQQLDGAPAPWEAVYTGSLRRHAQTWAGMAQGAGLNLTPRVCPGLNEYDSEALIRALPPCAMPAADTPEGYKRHFRLLRDALAQWMAGTISPQGMPSYGGFVDGIMDVLHRIQREHQGPVLVVSSGGPIATLVGRLLATPPESTIELNMQIRNTAVTELVYTARRARLVTFNALPHLDGPVWRDWVTHA
jgi:broad specificity phosphatase PhoE